PIAAPAPAPTQIRSVPATIHANPPPNRAPTRMLMRNRRPPRKPITPPIANPTIIATGMSPPPMMMPIKVPTVPMTASPNMISNHRWSGMVPVCVASIKMTLLFPRQGDHRPEIDLDAGAGNDRNPPGLCGRLVLVNAFKIFVDVDLFFEPLADVLRAALYDDF